MNLATAVNWPTPTAGDAKASGAGGYSTESGRHSGTTLTDAVVGAIRKPRGSSGDWPTPTAALGEKSVRSVEGAQAEVERGKSPDLCAVAMANWPTPTSRDGKDGDCRDANVPTNALLGRTVVREPNAPKGALNPSWVCQLMNFPDGWVETEGPSLAQAPWELRWPSRPGEEQYEWEAPRVASGIAQRPAKLKALGNAVVPACATLVGFRLLEIIEGHGEVEC